MIDRFCLKTIQDTSPNIVAVRFYAANSVSEYTYHDLAVMLEDYIKLISKIVEDKATIIIMYPRSVQMLAMMLACLCKHMPFLYIDPSMPQHRISRIIEETKASYIFSEKPINEENLILKAENTCQFVYANRMKKPLGFCAAAYLLYTSGTTGAAKCVAVSRHNLLWFDTNIGCHVGFFFHKSVLASSNSAFDISILESIIPLVHAQTVHLLSNECCKNPKKIIRILQENKIDIVQFTPSHLRFLSMYSKQDFSFLNHVKLLLIGGEMFPAELFCSITKGTAAVIYNMYGPSETTIWCSCKKIINKEKISIGRPLIGCEFSIHDSNGNSVKDGQSGELWIRGEQNALGYLDPAVTEKYFVLIDNERYYKTGDIVRRETDGEYYILGRKDNQIKYKGHRIELDEICEQILHIEDVLYCFVKNEEKYLCCYYYSRTDIHPSVFIRALKKVLPQYMIPTKYQKLEKVHFSSNGKLLQNANFEEAMK